AQGSDRVALRTPTYLAARRLARSHRIRGRPRAPRVRTDQRRPRREGRPHLKDWGRSGEPAADEVAEAVDAHVLRRADPHDITDLEHATFGELLLALLALGRFHLVMFG